MDVYTYATIHFTTSVNPDIADFYRWRDNGFDGSVEIWSTCCLRAAASCGYWYDTSTRKWNYQGRSDKFLLHEPVVPIFAELGDVQNVKVFGVYGKFEGSNAVVDHLAKEAEAVTYASDMVKHFEQMTGVQYNDSERTRLVQKLLYELTWKALHQSRLDSYKQRTI